MKSIDELFPSPYFKAVDLDGDTTLTMSGLETEDIRERNGDTKRKGVLSFSESEKKLILNRTNAEQIASLHGRDFEHWSGKQVTLYATPVSTPEGTRDGIRVRSSVSPQTQEEGVRF
jgi:hypothetical protein